MSDNVKRIAAVVPPHPYEAYAHIVSPLKADDGGGFLITFPDLPGCMSDGQTIEEAITNGRDAFEAVIAALVDMGRDIPGPSFQPQDVTAPNLSGKFVTRVPKSVHAQLARRAKAEGVSLNSMVLTLISEGLGRRERQT